MRLNIGSLVAAVALATSCSVGFGSTISPGQVSQIVTFGDSLSDAGNASIATLGASPGTGYATRTVIGRAISGGIFHQPADGDRPFWSVGRPVRREGWSRRSISRLWRLWAGRTTR